MYYKKNNSQPSSYPVKISIIVHTYSIESFQYKCRNHLTVAFLPPSHCFGLRRQHVLLFSMNMKFFGWVTLLFVLFCCIILMFFYFCAGCCSCCCSGLPKNVGRYCVDVNIVGCCPILHGSVHPFCQLGHLPRFYDFDDKYKNMHIHKRKKR